MTLKDLPIGKTATVTAVGGEGSASAAFSGYGYYSHGRCDYGEICAYGGSCRGKDT